MVSPVLLPAPDLGFLDSAAAGGREVPVRPFKGYRGLGVRESLTDVVDPLGDLSSLDHQPL